MSLIKMSTNNTNEDYLSSNDKVIHYLQNSTCNSTKPNNSLSMLKRSPSSNLYLLQNRLRYCSENDSISSSSSSVMDSLSRSDFSLESSLSDPIARCSIFNSNISSEEDIDFNIGFDQISDDDDDDDYDDDETNNKYILNKKQADTVTLHGKSLEDIHIKKLEDFIHRSSSATIFNDNHEFNHDDTIVSNSTKQQQQQHSFLHDSTYTLCSQDPFSAYTEDHDHDQENERISGFNIRSNSLSALRVDQKSTLVEKAPKKAVRFADMLVCY
ncbi:unnamed protein product [Rotaria sp. Silwood1]|nr:unnamed protein product [Rotaria sp. Silwood1]CAF1256045.1 unnamed protein product [Rotaria sp. Silwood1]